MTPREQSNCEALRKSFEAREAIYIEKGVLRVRVENITFNLDSHSIRAEVEEIRTPGLYPSLFHGRIRQEGFPQGAGRPLRWRIGAGHLTTFSADSWAMGYGGWSLFLDPGTVDGLIALACEWPDEVGLIERYNRSLKFLHERPMTQRQKVFCDLANHREE